jgi:hypothetical protein
MLQDPMGWVAFVLPGLPRPPTASRSFWLPSGFILKISYLWDKTISMFRYIFHKLKIFFCDDDVEKIYVRDRTGLSIRHISRIINHTKVEEI